MENVYVITISHLLGCGGSYVGSKLSEMLSIPFVDRQILKKVSDTLNVSEKVIEDREERKSSFWEVFFREQALADPMTTAAGRYMPSDRELYALETKYIEQIATAHSCIILGRGGNYILRNHPHHLRVFVYANVDDRIKRVSELYKVSGAEAGRIIEKNDKERQAYIKTHTGTEMLDLRNYDICLNTSSFGLDNCVALVKNALDSKWNYQDWFKKQN